MRQGKRFGFKKALGASAVCAVALFASLTPAASAQFEVKSLEVSATVNGKMSRQAGAHPDLDTTVKFARRSDDATGLEGNARDVRVDLPAGLLGNPKNFPTCPVADLIDSENALNGYSDCPYTTAVGRASVEGGVDGSYLVYSLEHGPDTPALFGVPVLNVPVFIEPVVRAGDYGISALSLRTSQAIPLLGIKVDFWGVPADSSHDEERDPMGIGIPTPSPLPRTPFMSLPTSCSGEPLSFGFSSNSWLEPNRFSSLSTNVDSDGTPFVMEGCERLPFAPTLGLQASSHAADDPVGIDATVTVPQNESPDGLSTAHVRKTVVTLPKGFTINPAAAATGLSSCTEAQINLGSVAPPTCPEGSSLGTVKVKTPLLAEELEGNVYLARQDENPFNSMLAMYVVVKGPGFYLRLPGKVELDPDTAQVITSFSEIPQLPFEVLKLSLRSGQNAPLITPSTCGTYNVNIQMTSWASAVPVELNSPIGITEGCAAGGFNPKLRAGTATPTAGAYSPFSFQVTRNDGEQNLTRVGATLPEGLLAKLAGVTLCAGAAAASGDCPASSQIGTTTVGAGAGSSPIYIPVPGRAPTAIYLAGPYKGAQYSMVVKVPAQAGPFDLGNVVVRTALNVDPVTTEITAISDPLPQILKGVPVSYRDVRVEVNRPDFTLNPTSCDAKKVVGSFAGSAGASAHPVAPFQAVNCERLGFKPTLAMKLSGPTHRSAYPALRAVVSARPGDANIGRAQVTLPKTEFLENAHIQTICTRVQYAANNCPQRSIYGHAKAWSPLLDEPVQGPVYLRSSDHELPDLVASLDGAMHVDLAGRIDSVNARIRNTFDFVPDAPVSKFVLTMQGGKKGLLVNNTELCKTTPRVEAMFEAHNGKVQKTNPVAKADCGKARKKDKSKKREARR